MLLSQKSAECEAEIQRIKISAIRTEEEKINSERKAAEAELLATTMVEESERRAKEAEVLRIELLRAKVSENEAKEKLIDLLRSPAQPPPSFANTFHQPQQQSSPSSMNGTSSIYITAGHQSPTLNNNVALNHMHQGSGVIHHSPRINYHHQTSHSMTSREFRDYNDVQELQIRADSEALLNNMRTSIDSINSSQNSPYRSMHQSNGSLITVNTSHNTVDFLQSTSCDLLTDADVEKLAFEIEKERMEYLEKSRHLHNQLRDLKSEIQVLKVEEKLTPLDRIYENNSSRGETKYSTLRRTKSGTTKARVSFFEEL